MDPKDEGKGFKGLGKLGGSTPPAPPVPPPQPDLPPPMPGPGPAPQPHSTGSGGGITPPPGNSSGCLKVGLVLVVVLFLTGGLAIFLLRTFAPAKDDASYESASYEPAATPEAVVAPDPAEAARIAAEEAEAALEQARLAACLIDAGTRPDTGEVLVRNIGEGRHQLKINGGVNDALVKLRNDEGTALAFYVRSFETAEFNDIPDGTYRVMFAGGSDYSRSCNEFVTGMSVSADPEPVVFEITEQDGKRYFAVMEYTLEQTAGGNFEPAYVDPADFRD